MATLVITSKPTLDEVLLTPKQVAARWNKAEQTLNNMRSKGVGPRYRKMENGTIRYPDWAVFEFEMGRVAA